MTDKLELASLDAIDHVALTVNDIKQTLAWYKEHFNCNVLYQDDTWAFIEFSNIKVALVIPAEHPSHIAFISQNASKFGPLTTHRDGTRSTYIKDPDGNSVEILEQKPSE